MRQFGDVQRREELDRRRENAKIVMRGKSGHANGTGQDVMTARMAVRVIALGRMGGVRFRMRESLIVVHYHVIMRGARAAGDMGMRVRRTQERFQRCRHRLQRHDEQQREQKCMPDARKHGRLV